MTEHTHEQRLTRVLTDGLGVTVDQMKPDARFAEDLGADSLDMVSLTMDIEDEFEISITDEQAANVITVRDAAMLVDQLTAAEAAPRA